MEKGGGSGIGRREKETIPFLYVVLCRRKKRGRTLSGLAILAAADERTERRRRIAEKVLTILEEGVSLSVCGTHSRLHTVRATGPAWVPLQKTLGQLQPLSSVRP